MTDWRVLSVSAAGGNRPHDDLAGVHADASFDRQVAGLAQSHRVTFQFFLHPQSGMERALRMILMRDRGTEQCEDAVAGALHDVAVVPPHRVDHQLQRRIDNRARLLWVKVLLQLRRALDISEQRRDGLSLPVES